MLYDYSYSLYSTDTDHSPTGTCTNYPHENISFELSKLQI